MDLSENINESESLASAIANYNLALEAIETDAQEITLKQVLEVMLIRDKIELICQESPSKQITEISQLINLDKRLKQQNNTLNQNDFLTQCRQSLQPPTSSWWWYLEADPITETTTKDPWWTKFDWLWNLGTVTCLVISTTFITQTGKVFSDNGFDILTTLNLIAQGAGVVFVAGGALTDKGQKTIEKVLNSVKIPGNLHAEFTFILSLAVLAGTVMINNELPSTFTNYYFKQAQKYQKEAKFSKAIDQYERALNFSQDDPKIIMSLAMLYEQLDRYEEAEEYYNKGAGFGIPVFLNARARFMLFKALRERDWQKGIDDQTIKQVQRLLDRAEEGITNNRVYWQNSITNETLFIDIKINKGIAALAQINLNQKDLKVLEEQGKQNLGLSPNKLLTNNQEIIDHLNEAYEYFNNDRSKINNQEELNDKYKAVNDIYIIGKPRENCYKALSLYLLSLVGYEQYPYDAPTVHGFDFALDSSNLINGCISIIFSEDTIVYMDNEFINSYFFNNDYLKLFYRGTLSISFQYEKLKASNIIQDFDLLKQIKNKLVDTIENKNNFDPNAYTGEEEPKNNVVWKVIVDEKGKIFAYWAYDKQSRNTALQNKALRQVWASGDISKNYKSLEDDQNQQIKRFEFKVTVSPKNKVVEIIPWFIAYPTQSENPFNNNQKKLAELNKIFPSSYTPNLKNPSEIAPIIAGLLYDFNYYGDEKIWKEMEKFNPKLDTYIENPYYFEIEVTSQGYITDVQEISDSEQGIKLDQKASEKRKKDRENLKKLFDNMIKLNPSHLNKSSTVKLKVEVLGNAAFKFTYPPDNKDQNN